MMRADPRFKPLPREVATLVTEGKLIEAIKLLRRNNGLDLGQAKTWIDSHIAQDPTLRVQLEAQRREARRKFFIWFLLVDAVIAAVIIYFMFYRGSA